MNALEALWEYQKVDMQLDAVVYELRNSDERKRLTKLKGYILDVKEGIDKIEGNAASMIEEFNSLEKRYTEISAKLIECREKLMEANSGSDQNAVSALQKEIQDVNEELQRIEKATVELMGNTEKQAKKYVQIATGGNKGKKEYDQVKVEYDEKKKNADTEAKEIKAKLAEMAKNIDKEYISLYNKIKANRPMPIAELVDNRCTGCHMELPPVFSKRVDEADKPVECENCGRILIKR